MPITLLLGTRSFKILTQALSKVDLSTKSLLRVEILIGITYTLYSHVHISSDEVLSKILKKPSIVQK